MAGPFPRLCSSHAVTLGFLSFIFARVCAACVRRERLVCNNVVRDPRRRLSACLLCTACGTDECMIVSYVTVVVCRVPQLSWAVEQFDNNKTSMFARLGLQVFQSLDSRTKS